MLPKIKNSKDNIVKTTGKIFKALVGPEQKQTYGWTSQLSSEPKIKSVSNSKKAIEKSLKETKEKLASISDFPAFFNFKAKEDAQYHEEKDDFERNLNSQRDIRHKEIMGVLISATKNKTFAEKSFKKISKKKELELPAPAGAKPPTAAPAPAAPAPPAPAPAKPPTAAPAPAAPAPPAPAPAKPPTAAPAPAAPAPPAPAPAKPPTAAPAPPAPPTAAPAPPVPAKPPTTAAPAPPAPAAKPPTAAPAPRQPIPVAGDAVKKMIMQHEGVVPYPYKDSKGLWTIGVGHLLGGDGKTLPPEYAAYKNNGGPYDKKNNKTPAMTNEEIAALFDKDYEKHKEIAMKTPGWNMANENGQAAMIDLAFNMGAWYSIKDKSGKGIMWKNTVAALESGDFESAAKGLKDSAWYTQVGNRAVKIVDMISRGAKNISPAAQPTNFGQEIHDDSVNNAEMKKLMGQGSSQQIIVQQNVHNTTNKQHFVPSSQKQQLNPTMQ